MATVTGYTAERMAEIEAQCIVAGAVDLSGDLILTKQNGTTVNAGNVIGPTGLPGTFSGTAGGVDNVIPRANGTGGTVLQASLASIDDAGVIRTEQMRLNQAPTQTYHAATKAYVDAGSAAGCIITRTVDVTVPDSSIQVLAYTGADLRDTGNYHNPLSLAHRVYIPFQGAGWYSIDVTTHWEFNVNGLRGTYYGINGNTPVNMSLVSSSGGFCVSNAHADVQLADLDYVELFHWQSSGGVLTLGESTASFRRFAA